MYYFKIQTDDIQNPTFSVYHGVGVIICDVVYLWCSSCSFPQLEVRSA